MRTHTRRILTLVMAAVAVAVAAAAGTASEAGAQAPDAATDAKHGPDPEALNALRESYRGLRERNEELTRTVRELQAALRDARERLAAAEARLAEHGIEPERSDPIRTPPPPGPDINGVVRAVRTADGVRYATISLGRADGVTRDMRFNVIDVEEGRFLGYLTVEAVEANEATGRLDGPNVKAVKPGHQVATQL